MPQHDARMAGVDVVWCDFGGVLTPPIEQAVGNVVAATGVPWDALMGAARRVARGFGVAGALAPLELGLCSQAEWGRLVEAQLLPGTQPRVPLSEFGEHWYAGRGVADPVVLGSLARLRRAGVRVGLLTNSVAEWEPMRERMLRGVSVFDIFIRSHEVGVAKPDPLIYAIADSVLPARGRALLIDDSASNCLVARSHGWRVIEHVDAATTATALLAEVS